MKNKNAKGEILSSTDETSSLEMSDEFYNNFKAMFNIMNATPDSQVKLFNKDKIISVEDIKEINDKVQAKLKNHHIIASKISISISLTNDKAKKFSSWEEFLREDWRISPATKSFSIEWHFRIKLPKYKIPQPHTLKLRMGSIIRPNELFQIMFTNDDDIEVDTAMANTVCKIDFVNHIIANEFFNLVDEWYKGLKDYYQRNKMVKFLKDRPSVIARVLHTMFPLLSLVLLFKITGQILNSYETINLNSPIVLKNIYLWGCVSVGTIYSSNIVGNYIGSKTFKLANSFVDFTSFDITKGDNNKRRAEEEQNKKSLNQIILQIVATILYGILSFGFDYILNLF